MLRRGERTVVACNLSDAAVDDRRRRSRRDPHLDDPHARRRAGRRRVAARAVGSRDRLARIMTGIAPWISVSNATEALAFYKAAFGAVDIESHADDSGALQVAQLFIGGAEFWIQTDTERRPRPSDRDAAGAHGPLGRRARHRVQPGGRGRRDRDEPDGRRLRMADREGRRSVRPRLGDRAPPRR